MITCFTGVVTFSLYGNRTPKRLTPMSQIMPIHSRTIDREPTVHDRFFFADDCCRLSVVSQAWFSVYVSNAVLTPGNNILCGGTFMSLHVSATVRVVLVSVGC